MHKKSIERVMIGNENTKKGYLQSISIYERFNNMGMDELVQEALDEQTQRVPEHKLKIYDRLMDFQEYVLENYVGRSVQTHIGRIKTVYKMNRVKIPYLPPINQKQVKRNPSITYYDILTKEEIKEGIKYLTPSLKARVMLMATGGYSINETSTLTLRQFLDDLKPYHHSDDETALQKLSQMDNVVWVTQLIRVKTQKPYFGICNPETVQAIAEAWIKKDLQYEKRKYGTEDLKLFNEGKTYVSQKMGKINDDLGFGKAGGRRRFTPHSLRRFNATRLSGASLSDAEHMSLNMIDEIQGRSMNNVQDKYIKTNPVRQKLMYVKVMNNVSLYNQYEYELIDGDVKVTCINHQRKNRKLQDENKKLKKELFQHQKADVELKNYIESVGKDTFKEQLERLLGEL